MNFPPINLTEAKDVLRQAAWRDYGKLGALVGLSETLAGLNVTQEVLDAARLLEDVVAVHSRLMVHMITGFGCDVDVTYALDRADEAVSVRWAQGLLGIVLRFEDADGKAWAVDCLPEHVIPSKVTS